MHIRYDQIILKTVEKKLDYYKGIMLINGLIVKFSSTRSETRDWEIMCSKWQDNCSHRILYVVKLLFKKEGEIKPFADKIVY